MEKCRRMKPAGKTADAAMAYVLALGMTGYVLQKTAAELHKAVGQGWRVCI